MIIECLANSGNSLPEEYLLRGWTKESRMGLVKGRNYNVYGIMATHGLVDYLVYNSEVPFWYPAPLFEIVLDKMPSSWHCAFVNDPPAYLPQFIAGYKELVQHVEHYENLIEHRQQEAWSIFFRRKKEIDKEIEEFVNSTGADTQAER